MKCRNCADCGCKRCTLMFKNAGANATLLRDGVYDNATVTIRGGQVTAVQRGVSTFHSFTDPCAVVVDTPFGEDPAGAVPGSSGLFLQSSTSILIEGRGTSSSPAVPRVLFDPVQFSVGTQGLTLKDVGAPGVSQSLCDLVVEKGRVVKLPTAIITGVKNLTPETLTADIQGCVLNIGIEDNAGIKKGSTVYTTFVQGQCKGPYPIWVTKSGSMFTLNVGPLSVAEPAKFPNIEAAIIAADGLTDTPYADCPPPSGN